MVMLTLGTVETVLDNNPALDSVDYRNAWATVEARLVRTTDPDKRTHLQALHTRMVEMGEPVLPPAMSREQALAQAQAANEARVVGRCKAQIVGKIASATFQRTTVSDRKPWLFEAALQLIEDRQASMHSFREEFPERGFQPAAGVRKYKHLTLAPYDPWYTTACPWTSKRNQAAEERI